MPSLTTDGPDIPIEVLQALEDGELVFFCGAGVSMPAGLPLFGELVKVIYECVREETTELEKKAFKNSEYDRVLTLLERRVDAIHPPCQRPSRISCSRRGRSSQAQSP